MSPRVEVHPDRATLATAVAGELLARLAEIQQSGREPHIALTGGTVARTVHSEVARLSPSSDVDWSRVVIWWGDERFVARDSGDRNEQQSRADFLDAVGATRVHPMPHRTDASDVHAAAAAYDDLLDKEGPELFDVLMLGVGPDGHVASLFPSGAAVSISAPDAVAVLDSPKPPRERISLTLPRLNRSAAVWFLVSGEEKAEAVEAALAVEGEIIRIPARGVEGQTESIWFLDKAAASLL